MRPNTKFKPRSVRYACLAELARYCGSGRAPRYGGRPFSWSWSKATAMADLALWNQPNCLTDGSFPEVPSLGVEGTAQEHREP